jgi:hypothetical protein
MCAFMNVHAHASLPHRRLLVYYNPTLEYTHEHDELVILFCLILNSLRIIYDRGIDNRKRNEKAFSTPRMMIPGKHV